MKKIAERNKLRKQRFNEIIKKQNMISPGLFEKYFDYSNPGDMSKTLNETTGWEENKGQVNKIENRLANLMEELKSSPTSDARKIRNINNMLEIVGLILYFNQLNQTGKG